MTETYFTEQEADIHSIVERYQPLDQDNVDSAFGESRQAYRISEIFVVELGESYFGRGVGIVRQ